MLKRIGVTLVNIFFPPFGVLLLCGPEMDMVINCILFLCAVIPSHIHAFYISMTYFSRKKKVRKGRYPGDWKHGIYSEKVQYGGASRKEYLTLKDTEKGGSNALGRTPSTSSKSRRGVTERNDGFVKNRTSIYARPQMAQRTPSMADDNGYAHMTQGDTVGSTISRRQSSRRSTHGPPSHTERQAISRTPSGRSGVYNRPISGEISPTLQRHPSGRRQY